MPYLLETKIDGQTKREGPFQDVQAAQAFAEALIEDAPSPFVDMCLIDLAAPTFWKDMPHFALSPFNAPGDYVCKIQDGKHYRMVTRTREGALQLAASLHCLEFVEAVDIIPSKCDHRYFTMGGYYYEL